jgi:type IV secretion system protein VirB10
MSQALGQQFGQLTEEMIRKQMNVAPTIEIRPGYRFNVQVTKDLTFNGPYRPFDYERSIGAEGKTFRTPK